MASLERTAYPHFKRYFTNDELREIYTPTPAEIAFGLANTTEQKNFFNLIVLLKSFQRLGYFPPLAEIPAPIISHIRDSLNLPEEVSLGYDQSRSLYRHKSQIRDYLQVTLFNPEARHLISETVSQSAQVMDNPADLINVAIEVLVKDRYELPLLIIHPVHQRSPYNDLKKLPKKSSRNHLNDLLVHQVKTRDNLVMMFLKQVQKIQNKAQEELQLISRSLSKRCCYGSYPVFCQPQAY